SPVNPDTVRQIELARCVARLPPGELILRVRRELVDTRIAVAVAHEHRSIRRERYVRRQVERPTGVRHLLPGNRTEVVTRHAGIRAMALLADGLHKLAIRSELHELLMMSIGEPGKALRIEADGMGKLEQPRTP